MTTRLVPVPGDVVTPGMLDAVPPPARRYLDWAGVEGQPIPGSVAQGQLGRLRSADDKPWRPFVAEENFVTAPPGFSWRARVRVAGMPLVRGWDSYLHGRGWMQIRLGGVLTIADLHDGPMNQASLLRYLNEMVWFPAAYVLGNIRWAEIDERTAQVSITDAGLTASGTMRFGHDGRPLEFTALRHRHLGQGRFSLDRWVTPYSEYGELSGVRVPTAGWAEYRLPAGPLRYIELRVHAQDDPTGAPRSGQDARVWQMLTDPKGYFARARARARAEVERDISGRLRRARRGDVTL
jgi:hypothetical protein